MNRVKKPSRGKAPATSFAASRDLYLRLLTWVKPYWRVFMVSIIAMIVFALTEPALPALLKPLLDGSFVEKDPDMIRLMPLILIGLFLLRGAANYVSTVALNWVSNKVVLDLREHMFARLISFPSEFYDNNATGTLISRVVYNVTQVTAAATGVLIVLVRDTLAVIGLLAWMFYLNWKLALFVFLVGPLIVIVVKAISKRLRFLSHGLQTSMGDVTHTLEEAITGNKVVKVYGGQEYEKARFHESANWVRRYEMKIITTSAANVPIVQLIVAAALAAVIYLATSPSAQDQITVGEFVSFFGAMAMLFSPIKRLTSLNEKIQRGLAAAETIFSLLDQPAEPDSGTKALETVKGELRFEHVSFRYTGADHNAVDDFDLTIQPGETVAFVGASGSGKTTLAHLIPRFYQPTSGRILLDGIDTQEVRLADLRRHIALVSQDVVLFNDSVAANIAYGEMAGADAEAIQRAANAAHATEYVSQLPQGIETVIGERGMRLSGGQRQRLAIARALLKNAQILIFDEATSALDNQSERYVQEAIDTLKAGRTTIIIAHRLSTIEKADRIVVLEKGKIVEIGNHAELLARGGTYASLYQLHHARGATVM